MKTAQQQADEQHVKLLAVADMPRDPYLQVVLCQKDGGYQPFVTWIFNSECGGFHEGVYRCTLKEGMESFLERCNRWEAVPCEAKP
jgi:hypothetical protein